MKFRWRLVAALSAALASMVAASAQTPVPAAATPLERRAAEICNLIRAAPGDYEKVFASTFLTKVPPPQLTMLLANYFATTGACTQSKRLEGDAASGKFEFTFANGYTVAAELAIDLTEPRLVTGLFLAPPVRLATTLEAVVEDLKTFPGETSFIVMRLGAAAAPVIAHNADRQLAVGSAFKLYILSELVRSIGARERKWTDIIPLNGRAQSLPSGILQTWPAGSPMSVYSLAALMVSASDNTAADQLLMTLGRERVERVQAATGHTKPDLNMPFLSTLELFQLKGDPAGGTASTYLSLDARGRREFLGTMLTGLKRADLKPFANGRPMYVDRIEWFASASDLCRLMDWLRQKSETDRTARDILAINPGSGLTIPRDKWTYVGFKGGSEPGVLNMTYLLQSASGDWYAMSMGWNNTRAALDNDRLFGLVQRVLQLIQ